VLAQAEAYLAFRRALGFTLGSLGQEVLLFARYADRVGHTGPLTTALIVRWAQDTPRPSPPYWAWRFHGVRLFAQHCAVTDPATEVPPAGLLGPTFRRGHPHIYSTAEIAALLQAAGRRRPRTRPHTYLALFGLLAATGLRVGEALALRRADVDLTAGLLTIRKGKAGQSRLVPLHPSTTTALRRYAAVRDRIHVSPHSDVFFLSVRGTALTYRLVNATFRMLRRQLGWPAGAGAPRVHDLRHTFAVRVLVQWYDADVDIDTHIATLATYLGHVNVTFTYWYLTAAPELMAIGARRFETYTENGGRA
jgi:integrase